MNRSKGSIKAELNDAVVCGIRQRGPDAVGLLLVGLAGLVLEVAVLGVLLGIAALLGCEIGGIHFAGLTGVSGLITWRLAFWRSTPPDRSFP